MESMVTLPGLIILQVDIEEKASFRLLAIFQGSASTTSQDGVSKYQARLASAGRPILGAIEGEGLDGVCVLVTRYAQPARDLIRRLPLRNQ